MIESLSGHAACLGLRAGSSEPHTDCTGAYGITDTRRQRSHRLNRSRLVIISWRRTLLSAHFGTERHAHPPSTPVPALRRGDGGHRLPRHRAPPEGGLRSRRCVRCRRGFLAGRGLCSGSAQPRPGRSPRGPVRPERGGVLGLRDTSRQERRQALAGRLFSFNHPTKPGPGRHHRGTFERDGGRAKFSAK